LRVLIGTMHAFCAFTPKRIGENLAVDLAPFMLILILIATAVLAGMAASVAVLRYPRIRPAAPGDVVEAIEQVAGRSARVGRWLRARRDPATATGLALSAALGVAIGGGLLLASLAYLVRGNDPLLDADSSVERWAHTHSSQASTIGLHIITQLGDTPAIAVLVVLLVVFELRRIRNLHVVLFLAAVILGNFLGTTAIKDLADRARPTLNAFAATLGPSFPSGHSSTAASFYAAAALVLGRRRGRATRALLVGGAVALAVAVAASRVLLDDHWLSDVIAGLALGWAWFSLCAIAFGGRLLQFGGTVARAANDVRRPSTRDAPASP
jgi:membrane-associated phospholipid phosphatase